MLFNLNYYDYYDILRKESNTVHLLNCGKKPHKQGHFANVIMVQEQCFR